MINSITFSCKAPSSSASAAETVEGATLSLEGVDDVESSNGLSLGVFSVSDGVTDDALEEVAEDGPGLLVDERADSLDTTATSESADGGLSDAHDSVLNGLLGVTLGANLAVAFTTFTSSSSHYYELYFNLVTRL